MTTETMVRRAAAGCVVPDPELESHLHRRLKYVEQDRQQLLEERDAAREELRELKKQVVRLLHSLADADDDSDRDAAGAYR